MIPGPQLRSPSEFEARFKVPSPPLGKEEVVGEFVTSESNRPVANLLGVRVEALDMERTVARVHEALKERKKGYVCMVNVHGIMEAQRNPSIAKAYAEAMITVPDGAPTVWVGQLQGFHWMRRVAGPDLMLEVFQREQFDSCTHFLLGGKQGVAEELSTTLLRRFPWTRIVGTYTPPFRSLSQSEEEALTEKIRDLKPDIIWVGISTPKQEDFMRKYLPMFDTMLMFGVGAAFDFHTGRIKDCPEWIKRTGLQWLHRLMQDPRHLWWRYLRNNPVFIFQIILQLTGLRTYRASRAPESVLEKAPPGCDRPPDLCTSDSVQPSGS
jgi:N-acetylglucosaminyldiphosphoundecaprenol N-acetyl-beta-D-mannosaminyltransferase